MTYSTLAMPRAQSRAVVAPLVIPKVSRTVLYVTLACILGLLYLIQVTKVNSLGYKADDYNQKSAQLQSEHDDLVLQSARLQSMDRIQNYAANSGMVAVMPR